ncbi:MAG: hypothetical protein U0U09_07200 [Cyclobacteriaceae bacterium]
MHPLLKRVSPLASILIVAFIVSCSDDSKPSDNDRKTPKPELINAFFMEAYYDGGIEPKWMDFDDSDDDGVLEPTYSSLGLGKGTQFRFELQGFGFRDSNGNWTTAPIPGRMDDHLFCFEVTNGVLISNGYPDSDLDSNGKPTGLSSLWTTSSVPKTGSIKITLYHQPKTKTGDCDVVESVVDFEVVLPVEIF